MYNNIKYEAADGIAHITVNRPDAMNALNDPTLDELFAAFSEADADDAVKAVILTGAGKAFIAGADIAAMSKMTALEGKKISANGHRVANLIEAISKPVIAAVNGFALGGGCEMAMACDIRIASEKAKFGQPEVGLGIIPGFGGNLRLPRLVGKGMAKKLIFTGGMIKAAEAKEIGLVEECVAPEELIPRCEELAKTIMAQAPIAVAAAKKVINSCYDADMETASRFEVEAFTGPFSSEDKAEGMGAFLEKRKPEFKNK